MGKASSAASVCICPRCVRGPSVGSSFVFVQQRVFMCGIRTAKSLGGAPGRQVRHAARTGRQDLGGGAPVSLRLWTGDVPVPAPARVSCPQRAEPLECTAPVCCSPAPLHPLSPRGLPTGQRRTRDFCFSSKMNPLLITAALIYMVRLHSSLNTRFSLRAHMTEPCCK